MAVESIVLNAGVREIMSFLFVHPKGSRLRPTYRAALQNSLVHNLRLCPFLKMRRYTSEEFERVST